VQKRRWQEYLDGFNLASSMPDIMNVKYFVVTKEQYEKDKASLGAKYVPVFASPDGNSVVLENRAVLPKAWLVPSVAVVADSQGTLGILQNPQFDPRWLAVVESQPPVPLDPPNVPQNQAPGRVQILRMEPERIELESLSTKSALLVLGEKYYKGWRATVDGKATEIYPVDHVLRGVYVAPGSHKVEFVFDPMPFKIGKYLTLASFAFFLAMLVREYLLKKKARVSAA
jgi:hypothetical protein